MCNKWGIYSGDVNVDGVIDLDDLIDTYNAGNVPSEWLHCSGLQWRFCC
ncbi:MAG: hypothetical protein R2942_18980 [Ignavibacteria bacterium]